MLEQVSTQNPELNLPERLLKAKEIAEVLNISKAFAYQLMKRGEIPTVQIGTARRVRPADLESFIENNLMTLGD